MRCATYRNAEDKNDPNGVHALFLRERPALSKVRDAGPTQPAQRPVFETTRFGLFQRAVDRGELGIQVAAKTVDRDDDRNRDASGNQPVFDGGSARLVTTEFQKCLSHGPSPFAPRKGHTLANLINLNVQNSKFALNSCSDFRGQSQGFFNQLNG